MAHQETKDQASRFFLGNKQSEAYQNVPGYGQPNYGNSNYNPAGRFSKMSSKIYKSLKI